MKQMMTIAVAMMALAVGAQEFGAGRQSAAKEPVLNGGGVEAIGVAQEQVVLPTDELTAEQQLEAWIQRTEGIRTGYDEKKERVVVIHSREFDVEDPTVSNDFLRKRAAMMDELLLTAKAEIVSSMMSEMSASRILEIPGNPLEKKVKEELSQVKKELIGSVVNPLKKLDEGATAALKRPGNMSAEQLVTTLTDWFATAEQAKAYKGAQLQKYQEAHAAFLAAKKKYTAVMDAADEHKNTIAKSMKTSVGTIAQMPIYGCTVLQQAESYRQKREGVYQCQLAVVYAWSKEMQLAAGEILKGNSITCKPGKRTVKEWLKRQSDSGALATWCGPRNFIDNEGKMWFLGISCTPVEADSEDNNNARDVADLYAQAEVIYSLYADVASSQQASKETITRIGEDGAKKSEYLETFLKSQREAFTDIRLAGNMNLFSDQMLHAASELDINVSVYGICAGSAQTLRSIKASSIALGIEVNTAQEVERGRQAQLQSDFEASKTNAAARAAGAAQAKQDVVNESAKARARRAQRRRAAATPVPAPKAPRAGGKTSGTLRAGSTFFVDDDAE